MRFGDEGGRDPAHTVRGTRWHCVATGVRCPPPTIACHPERSTRRVRSRRISCVPDSLSRAQEILRLRCCAPALRMTQGVGACDRTWVLAPGAWIRAGGPTRPADPAATCRRGAWSGSTRRSPWTRGPHAAMVGSRMVAAPRRCGLPGGALATVSHRRRTDDTRHAMGLAPASRRPGCRERCGQR